MSDDLEKAVDAAFDEQEGALVKGIDGFCQRPGQKSLSMAIVQALKERKDLVTEAPTGTGKTFAYLVPVILSGKKGIISTGTKHLQDQLYFSDLPRLLKALDIKIKTAYLKGRANYLCHYRIHLYSETGHFDSKETVNDLMSIKKRLPTLRQGDVNECIDIKEDSDVWPYVTSHADNCLGQECDFIQDCFLQKARKKALSADLLVINHHLFFADSILKADGFAEVLPSAKVVVFDEAHQLVNLAASAFGERLSSRQIGLFCQDLDEEIKEVAKESQGLLAISQEIEKTLEDLCLLLPDDGKYFWHEIIAQPKIEPAFNVIYSGFDNLCDALAVVSGKSQGLERCYERAAAFRNLLKTFLSKTLANHALWITPFRKSFILYCSPLDVSSLFPNLLNHENTDYIFTSATLSVDDKLSHFKDELGLTKVTEQLLSSPFNIKDNAILYMPRQLPDYKHKDFIEKLIDNLLPVIDKLNGRTLFLFTSYRALYLAKASLKAKTHYQLLVQGDKPKHQLLAAFKKRAKGSLLLATSSFWEGVDIKGQDLSMVVIDKLPFDSPKEPIVAAKIEKMAKLGCDPFMEYQIPKAILSLKQGMGRLLRGEKDCGIIVIGDPRIYGRAYGERFISHVMDMKKTREEKSVLEFINDRINLPK